MVRAIAEREPDVATRLEDYVASGFLLSRYTGDRDCTGLELRRVTLAHDHSQRRFFPESWTLSWCSESREERLERAAAFGIAEQDLDRVIAWADRAFGSEFGAWDVLFTVESARAAARSRSRRDGKRSPSPALSDERGKDGHRKNLARRANVNGQTTMLWGRVDDQPRYFVEAAVQDWRKQIAGECTIVARTLAHRAQVKPDEETIPFSYNFEMDVAEDQQGEDENKDEAA